MADKLIEMTADIVSGYVTGNKVAVGDLPALIKSIREALANVDKPPAPGAPEQVKLTPAQIRKSITDKGLVSFEDGRTYQTLKRHLTLRGLTLAAYKAKWGLPKDYPTTAPAYAAKRSELAKRAGLGQGGRRPQSDEPASAPTPKATRSKKAPTA